MINFALAFLMAASVLFSASAFGQAVIMSDRDGQPIEFYTNDGEGTPTKKGQMDADGTLKVPAITNPAGGAVAFPAGASGISAQITDLTIKSQASTTLTLYGGRVNHGGRLLTTYDGAGTAASDFGGEVDVDLATKLASPAVDTLYYICVDSNGVSPQVTSDSKEQLYGFTPSNVFVLPQDFDTIDDTKYYCVGSVKTDSGGAGWSGGDAAFGQTPTKTGKRNPVVVNPVVFTLNQAVGAVGSVGQISSGHVLADDTFPYSDLTGKVYYWNMDTVNDGSGNNRHLTNSNSTPLTGTGVHGLANTADFNGTNQSLNRVDASFNTPGDMSMGCHFAADDWVPSSSEAMMSTQNSNSDRGALLWLTSGGLISAIMGVSAGSINQDVRFDTNDWVNGSWHHVLMTRKGTILTLYIDGRYHDSTDLVVAYAGPTTPEFRIGARNSTASDFYDGRAQHCIFAHEALSAEDVRKLAAAKITHNKNIDPTMQNWVASYERDDGMISNIFDPGWIVDLSADSIYLNLNLAAADTVHLKLADMGYGTAVAASDEQYDSGWQSAEQSFPLAHGLPGYPTSGVFQYKINATEQREYPIGDFCKATTTQLDCEIDDILNVDATNQYRIVLSVGPSATVIGEATETQAGVVSTNPQTLSGKKTFVGGISAVNDHDGQNLLINGDMKISQRSGIWTTRNDVTTAAYVLDRWKMGGTSDGPDLAWNTTNQPPGLYGSKSLRVTFDGATGTNKYVSVTQMVEDYIPLNGETVTLSMWMKTNNTALGKVRWLGDDSGIDSFGHTGGGSWEYVHVTTTFGTSLSSGNVSIGSFNDSLTNGDYLEITHVMFNKGAVPAKFRLAGGSAAGELRLAQRYYQKSYDLDIAVPTGSNYDGMLINRCDTDGSSVDIQVIFPVRMRAAPTVELHTHYQNCSGASTCNRGDNHCWRRNDTTHCIDSYIERIGESGFYTRGNGCSGNNYYGVHWEANAEL